MKLEEAIENIKEYIKKLDDYIEHLYDANGSFKGQKETYETVIAELHAMQNLLDEKNEEIEHLQKENEELNTFFKRIEDKDLDEANIRAEAMLDMDKIWRNKIREKIEEIEKMANGNKIIENTIRYKIEMALLKNLLKEE